LKRLPRLARVLLIKVDSHGIEGSTNGALKQHPAQKNMKFEPTEAEI